MKNFKLNVLLIIVSLAFLNHATFAQTVDERINRALAAINKDDLNSATTDISEVLKSQPDNATAFYLRGLVDFKQAKYDEAIADQTKAIQLNSNPKFVEFYYERGCAYSNKPNPDYKAALADFSHALEIVPSYKSAYVERGWANFKMRNWAAAESDYTQAIKYGANTTYIYVNRGAANYNLKNYEQAVTDYRKALELDPNNALAKKNLESAAAMVQNNSQSQSQTGGLSVAELLKRADEAKKSGDSVSQEKYLTAAINADPKNYDAYETRALMYDAAGKRDSALADTQQMIVLDPNNLDGFYLQASIYKDAKDYARAIPDYTSLLGLKLNSRQSTQTFYDRGIAYRHIYEYDKAVDDLSRALEIQSDIKGALSNRGEIYLFQGNYDSAETDLKKLLKLDAGNKLATEDLELLKTLKNSGYNTGKTKEDTLLRLDEYSDRITSETEIYTKNLGLITTAANQNPNDTAKICSAVTDTDSSLKNIESNAAQINRLLSDGKFDKIPSLKALAQQLANLFTGDRTSLNADAAKYGCKLK